MSLFDREIRKMDSAFFCFFNSNIGEENGYN